MKTIVIVCLLLSMRTYAQAPLLNGLESFEQWDVAEEGQLPEYWDGFNRTVEFGGMAVGSVVCVHKDSLAPQEGNYSARIVSTSVAGGAPVSGMLTAGNLMVDFTNQTGDVIGGLAYNQTPTTFTGWYKYQPVGVDTASITVWFLSGGAQIAGNDLFISGTTTDWTFFSIDLAYPPGITPDTVNVLFSSSDDVNNVSEGSTLEIDAIQFIQGNAGVETLGMAQLEVYPNPAKEYLIVKVDENSRGEVSIYSANGKICLTQKIMGPATSISLTSLPSGNYTVVFRDELGSISTQALVK